jgi:hypothetical protein
MESYATGLTSDLRMHLTHRFTDLGWRLESAEAWMEPEPSEARVVVKPFRDTSTGERSLDLEMWNHITF